MKKYVLLSAGSMEWRVRGIYDSMEQIIDILRKDWGLSEEECNIDNIDDVISDGDMRVVSGPYYPSLQVQRDEKIDEIVK